MLKNTTPSNKFTVYNASAGSGKTYTLVKEYLLLLLKNHSDDSYRNILAITFTNKAVAEMKSRVIINLNALASKKCPANCSSLMKDLMRETSFSEEKIQSKSKKILKSILHNYASFDISTIDRFTHKIIRTFAKDLGIPLNFEVEMNTQVILQEAVDRLLNRAGDDKVLTRVLVNFTLTKTDDDKSWDISRDLFSFSRILLYENQQKYIVTLKGKTLSDFKSFGAKIKKELNITEDHIQQLAAAFFSIIKEEGLEKMDFNRGSCYSYFLKLLQKDYKLTYTAKWQTNIEEDKLYAGKCLPSKKAILDQYHSQICSLFSNSKAAFFRREYLKEIISNLVPLSLLSEILTEMNNIKKERSLVLISDFNLTIEAQVQNQPAPFIYERLGERYKNYFIDEFQDTSQMQWENMIPLIDHALTSQQENNEIANLTLVGDAKQSIYRFRGGRAEQFIDLYNSTNPFNIEKEVINLPFNYRSAAQIVDFNNSFFNFLADRFSNPTYRELFASCNQTCKKETKGLVNISFLETSTVEEDMELQPKKVLEIIEDLEKNEVPKSDICVLTRTRKQGIAVANFLSDKGHSIVSSESLLVANSPEVQFINSVLEFSINSTERSLKWNILNYLSKKLGIKDPHSFIISALELEQNMFFEAFRPYGINFNSNQVKMLSLYESAEYIIQSFQLIERSNAYVQFYLDFVFEKASKATIGIYSFLELWEQNKEKLSIVAPKTDNAVQIMTIHQSKGLEFPVVIYPFANYKLRDVSKESLWLPLPEGLNEIPFSYFKASQKMLNWGNYEAAAYGELISQTEFDAINVLYVAFTRASRQLHIISCLDLKKGEEYEDKVSGLLIGFLKSINKWDDSLSYEFGSNAAPEIKSINKDDSIHIQNNLSTPASEVVKLVTKNGQLWGSSQEEAINNGILVHQLLAETDDLQNLPAILKKLKKTETISQERESELIKLISSVITHPDLSRYFSEDVNVLKERDIIAPSGEILRPDRLNFCGKEVTIIDYKTGKLESGHKLQMEEYAHILSTMGFTVINKILVYINKDVAVIFI